MMTREEAIERLERLKMSCRDLAAGMPEEPGWILHGMALDMALTALRPVSRERIAELPRCEHCKDGKSFDGQMVIMGNKGVFPLNFCPWCGSPLTDEAVQMVMERLEALKDGSTAD